MANRESITYCSPHPYLPPFLCNCLAASISPLHLIILPHLCYPPSLQSSLNSSPRLSARHSISLSLSIRGVDDQLLGFCCRYMAAHLERSMLIRCQLQTTKRR